MRESRLQHWVPCPNKRGEVLRKPLSRPDRPTKGTQILHAYIRATCECQIRYSGASALLHLLVSNDDGESRCRCSVTLKLLERWILCVVCVVLNIMTQYPYSSLKLKKSRSNTTKLHVCNLLCALTAPVTHVRYFGVIVLPLLGLVDIFFAVVEHTAHIGVQVAGIAPTLFDVFQR